MELIQELNNRITAITLHIQESYPELYIFLDENPITVPSHEHIDINAKVLENYLISLEQMLENHKSKRGKPKA